MSAKRLENCDLYGETERVKKVQCDELTAEWRDLDVGEKMVGGMVMGLWMTRRLAWPPPSPYSCQFILPAGSVCVCEDQ